MIGSRTGGDTVSVAGDILQVDGVKVDGQSGTTTKGSNEVSGLSDALLLKVGETIVDNGVIPPGSTVSSIVSVNAITISNAATASATSTPLLFGITFGTLDVIADSGSNTNKNNFSSDGSIPHVILEGGSGNNKLSATISSSTGTAELIGGSGNNTLSATISSSTGTAELIGGGGTNNMTASGGITVLFGGAGANTMTLTGGSSTLLGGSGPNTYNLSGSGIYAVVGSTGTNTINISGGTATVTGGAGNNTYNITGAGSYTLTGGAGANALDIQLASSGDWVYLSQSGSTITASGTIGGADFTVSASNMTNPITDSLEVQGSQFGNNTLEASGMTTMGVYLLGYGSGNWLYGGLGPDTLVGGSGGDVLVAGNNSDILYVTPSTTDGSDTTAPEATRWSTPHRPTSPSSCTVTGYGSGGTRPPGSRVRTSLSMARASGRWTSRTAPADTAYYGGYDSATTVLATDDYTGNGQSTQYDVMSWSQAAYNLWWPGDTFTYYSPEPSYSYSWDIYNPPNFGGTFTITYTNATGLVSSCCGQLTGNLWDPLLNPYWQYPTGYDTYGYWGNWDVTLTVDPGINVTNLTAPATGTSGAAVTFPSSFTTGGAVTSGLTYYEIQNGTKVPVKSRSTFPIGTTTVYATATDGAAARARARSM